MNPTRYYLMIDTKPMNELDDFGVGFGTPCKTREDAVGHIVKFCEDYPETIPFWDMDGSYLHDRQTAKRYQVKPDATFWTEGFPSVQYTGGDDDETTDFVKDLFRMRIIENDPEKEEEFEELRVNLLEKLGK